MPNKKSTSKSSKPKKTKQVNDSNDDVDYNVGYKKPPVETQFKKGQSGNPKGRPKRSLNVMTLVREELDRPITLNENGVAYQVTKAEGIAKRLVTNALNGNPTMLKTLLSIMSDEEKSPDEDFKPSENDKAIFERLLKRSDPMIGVNDDDFINECGNGSMENDADSSGDEHHEAPPADDKDPDQDTKTTNE